MSVSQLKNHSKSRFGTRVRRGFRDTRNALCVAAPNRAYSTVESESEGTLSKLDPIGPDQPVSPLTVTVSLLTAFFARTVSVLFGNVTIGGLRFCCSVRTEFCKAHAREASQPSRGLVSCCEPAEGINLLYSGLRTTSQRACCGKSKHWYRIDPAAETLLCW